MRIWPRIKALGRRAQLAAVRLGLGALYLVGFGPVRLYLRLFRPALLSPPPPVDGSYWLPCDVGAFDPSASRRQS